MADLSFLTASQVAKAILHREVSAVEVLQACLQQVSKHHGKLNAIVTLDEERARQRAKEADEALALGELWGPLHGVPVTIKDAFETAGLRTTSGYKPLAGYVPGRDAAVVARLLAAGAIILGKSNMPPLAADYQTDNRIFGRTNNPWDPARTPGGSTGGGAAALAAGFSPLEMGSDAGGSLRIPAHFCGLFGFKPTENTVPVNGHIPPLPGSPVTRRHLLCCGPLARSVADLKLCHSVIAGPCDTREAQPVALELAGKRVLRDRRFVWTDDFGVPVTAETRSALEKLAMDLARLGCRVERGSPPDFSFARAWRTWGEIYATERHAAGPVLNRIAMLLATSAARRRSPIVQGLARGLRLSARSYLCALEEKGLLSRKLEQFLQGWDAWICPVASVPAFTHRKAWGPGSSLAVGGRALPYEMGASAYTAVFNVSGHPAVVMPLARSAEGLPIGVQLVGHRWRDMDLLDVADLVSARLTGPFVRPPGY